MPLTRKFLPLVGGIVYLPWSKTWQKVITWGFLLVIIGLQLAVNWTLSSQSYNHQLYLLGRY
jgi:membrane protein DedA with SNARE-associated domain